MKLFLNARSQPRRNIAWLMMSIFVSFPLGVFYYLQYNWIPDPPAVGSTIPNTIISNFNGELVNIDSLVSRKTVILFFSTSCSLCKNEIVSMNTVLRQFKDKMNFVGISLNSFEETSQFKKDFLIEFPIFLDYQGNAIRNYRVRSLPMLVLVDQRKRVAKYNFGAQTDQMLNDLFTQFSRTQIDTTFKPA